MPRSANPVPQYFDSDNKILAGGKVFYFNAGTSTPKTTYSDEGETIANPHPVILDAAGRLPNVFFTGEAKQILKDLNDIQIWERDNVGAVEQINDFNSYDLNVSYDAGDIVRFGGLFFISLQNSNQNNQPNTSLTFWTEIRFIEVYNTNIDYALGVVVQTSDGNIWKGVNSPNQGNDPSVDNGTNWKASIGGNLDISTVTTTGLATLDSLSVTNTSTLNDVNAQDTDSVLLKKSGSSVYTRVDSVGTVSESGGIPTGKLMESGSNANGNFEKFANGFMICTRNTAILAVGSNSVAFAETFIAPPEVSVSTEEARVSIQVFRDAIGANVSMSSVDSVIFVAGVISLTAIGRWY